MTITETKWRRIAEICDAIRASVRNNVPYDMHPVRREFGGYEYAYICQTYEIATMHAAISKIAEMPDPYEVDDELSDADCADFLSRAVKLANEGKHALWCYAGQLIPFPSEVRKAS